MAAAHPLVSVAFGISQITYLATILTLGVRLGRRARSRGEMAEGLLAAHFVLCAGIGYLLIALGLGASRGPGTLPASATSWFWLFYGTILTGIGWVMVEPLLYYRQMRRRRALGLADPMLVNRFALWSFGSTCRWLMVATGAVTGGVMEGNVSVTFTLTGTALLGLGVAVSYWLTFFPGAAYRRFILRRAEPLRA